MGLFNKNCPLTGRAAPPGRQQKGKEENEKDYARFCFLRNSRRLRVASTPKTTIMDTKMKDCKIVSIFISIGYIRMIPRLV
jgi:hypothetical protein